MALIIVIIAITNLFGSIFENDIIGTWEVTEKFNNKETYEDDFLTYLIISCNRIEIFKLNNIQLTIYDKYSEEISIPGEYVFTTDHNKIVLKNSSRNNFVDIKIEVKIENNNLILTYYLSNNKTNKKDCKILKLKRIGKN